MTFWESAHGDCRRGKSLTRFSVIAIRAYFKDGRSPKGGGSSATLLQFEWPFTLPLLVSSTNYLTLESRALTLLSNTLMRDVHWGRGTRKPLALLLRAEASTKFDSMTERLPLKGFARRQLNQSPSWIARRELE